MKNAVFCDVEPHGLVIVGISEEHVASIFRAEKSARGKIVIRFLTECQNVSLFLQDPQGVTFQ
jgi:hypothetical protein